MARMIPPECGAFTPAGERELFNKLRLDPNTESWIVLHSLDLKKHITKIEGELDMVILVPNLGVLCVEVKGCDVTRRDGKWIYPYETSIEGPFKQVSRSMHSLREYVTQRDASLKDIIFFSCVVFTRIEFNESSLEWHAWQVISRSAFLRKPISLSITSVLESAHKHFKRVHGNGWYKSDNSRPTLSQISKITALLRNNFEYFASPRVDVDQIEERIIQFTEEQFDALDLVDDNQRVIFKGPAGTGKTFLALESVRRAVIGNQRVLLICFNNLLNDWLKSQIEVAYKEPEKIDCKTFHGLLLKITGQSPLQNDRDFWGKRLPQLAVETLLEGSKYSQAYDVAIVDEAQDLMNEDYLDILDLLLVGGLAGGRWIFFGDFEKQAIYNDDPDSQGRISLELLTTRAPIHATLTLRNNCRNALPIADLLSLTCRLNPGYKSVLSGDVGFEAEINFYKDDSQKLKAFEDAIAKLLKSFKHSEIVVLSTKSDHISFSSQVKKRGVKYKLRPIRERRDPDDISYTSIYSFKGMEAAAVILTDIDDLSGDKNQALLYVGISRARVALVMLMKDTCRDQYNKLLDGQNV
jgi:hypothetical protein